MLVSSLTRKEQERLAYVFGLTKTAKLLAEVIDSKEEMYKARDEAETEVDDAWSRGFDQGYKEGKEDALSSC